MNTSRKLEERGWRLHALGMLIGLAVGIPLSLWAFQFGWLETVIVSVLAVAQSVFFSWVNRRPRPGSGDTGTDPESGPPAGVAEGQV